MRIGLVRKELRREVRAYLAWPRPAGLTLLALGMVLVVWPRVTGDWPMLGSLPLQWLGWGMVALAWAIFAVVIVRRSAFYRRRLQEIDGGETV
jgi:hypothetical protein